MLKPPAQFFTKTRWLFFLPFFLSIFGLAMIFDASSASALADFNDKFYYLKHQGIWFLLGVAAFLFFSRFDYHQLKKISLPFFIISFLTLILVLIPGIGQKIYGGRRWLPIFGWGFQPAEMAKLAIVIYLATLLEKRKDFFNFAAIVGAIFLLVILEPDLGTATIIAISAFGMYFIAGAPLLIFAGSSLFAFLAGGLLILFSPYRKRRLLTFLNSSFDLQGASYHIKQVLLALGSGGWFGRGLGQSRQKFLFLPEVTTDSIFAVIAEEFGFVGSFLLLAVFFTLIFLGIKTALAAKDDFGRILASGLIFFIGFQIVINLSAMVALIPLTGVPLPFISYGGSSLIICFAGMGILYNISLRAQK